MPNHYLPIDVHPNIQQQLEAGKPVVALESTIITHGMPWPQNYETAKSVETCVNTYGATAATIAVIGGRIKIGLSDAELENLAQSEDVDKLSRADLPACLVQKRDGSTTVAATMLLAHHAGIDVFATGGIGGVHSGVNDSFDISTDLSELATTAVTVVCAGAKAILDLPKTYEHLETLGVPVIGWQCDYLPAFWSSSSPLKTPIRMDQESAIAEFNVYRKQLGMAGGTLVCNPLPEEQEIPSSEMESLIASALCAASRENVTGKKLTPYLLQYLFEASSGRTLQTNISLIHNNAALAAKLAIAMADTPQDPST